MSTIALHSTFNVLETVRDRGLVPKDHQYKMAYGLSNGHVPNDVTWPQKCCEAVRSAIVATAWLLVIVISVLNDRVGRNVCSLSLTKLLAGTARSFQYIYLIRYQICLKPILNQFNWRSKRIRPCTKRVRCGQNCIIQEAVKSKLQHETRTRRRWTPELAVSRLKLHDSVFAKHTKNPASFSDTKIF